jgi:hypothetical protein
VSGAFLCDLIPVRREETAPRKPVLPVVSRIPTQDDLMFLAFLIVALVAATGLAVWILGKNELIHAVSDEAPAWFVAIRFRPDATLQAVQLPMGVRRKWSARADFTFVGEGERYWDQFMILAGAPRDSKLPVFLSGQIEDAYVARLKLQRPPVPILGVLRLLHVTGIRRMPRGEILVDPAHMGARPDAMPTKDSISHLLARDNSYRPAMVNFLSYLPSANYAADGDTSLSGRKAYGLYGLVALQTVYGTGGRLMFFGRVEEVLLEPKAGPTIGRWDDIAAMEYTEPKAILTMEQIPRYRAALKHRDAGLDRTVIIASTVAPG